MTAALDVPAHGPRALVRRLTRYSSVSVISTTVSVVVIVVATNVFALAAVVANIIATSIATVPSYHLNRRWTWARRDASNLWREVLPFWLFAFAGLALSTVTVALAASWTAHAHLAPELRTGAVLVGHLGGFGLLWILQFVLLDRVLFARRATSTSDVEGAAERI
jgi:putative flippase GtrA